MNDKMNGRENIEKIQFLIFMSYFDILKNEKKI